MGSQGSVHKAQFYKDDGQGGCLSFILPRYDESFQ